MEEKSFFYIDTKGVQQGPRTIKQLENEFVITHNTMVWSQGMKDWVRAFEVDELREICDNRPPVHHHVAEQTPLETVVKEENCGTRPHTWMVESILATLFCCVVTGIIGIIYSTKVDRLWNEKKYDEARSAANTSKIMFFIGVGVAGFFIICYLISIIFFTTSFSETMEW